METNEPVKASRWTANPKNNLNNSLLALGMLFLSGVVYIMVTSLIGIASKAGSIAGIILFCGMMLYTLALAVVTIRNCFRPMKTSKDNQTFAGLMISLIILLAIGYELWIRFAPM